MQLLCSWLSRVFLARHPTCPRCVLPNACGQGDGGDVPRRDVVGNGLPTTSSVHAVVDLSGKRTFLRASTHKGGVGADDH